MTSLPPEQESHHFQKPKPGYYLRFMDSKYSKELVAKNKETYWGPVDVYVGRRSPFQVLVQVCIMIKPTNILIPHYLGRQSKVLYDIGVVSTKEPFKCVINQGIILGEYTAYKHAEGNYVFAEAVDLLNGCSQEVVGEEYIEKSGEFFMLKDNPEIRITACAYKMSKSRGNAANPDDVVFEYGADSLCLYEMFVGPFWDSKAWSTSGIEGVHRFLGRIWRLVVGSPLSDGTFPDGTTAVDHDPSLEQLQAIHRCIAKVAEEIQGTMFNTGIFAMMEFINAAYKWEKLPCRVIEEFVLLLAPYAPHILEEFWSRLVNTNSLAYERFPTVNPDYFKDSFITVLVRSNGKTRGTIQEEEDCLKVEAFLLTSHDEKILKYIDGKSIKKRIFVPFYWKKVP